MTRRVALGVLLLVLLSGCRACAGSNGQLVGVVADASFVTEKATFVGTATDGVHRVALDGSRDTLLFAGASLRIEDVTADLGTYALGDTDTTLHLGDARTGRIEELAVAKGRVSAAAFSPDGKTLVVSRHGDYHAAKSPTDDTIYVVDVATRSVREIASASEGWPTKLVFSADGAHVLATMAWEKGAQWITLATGTREDGSAAAGTKLHESPLRARSVCPAAPAEHLDLSIVLLDDAGARTEVAREEGRKRGFHDYEADFTDVRLSPSCAHVTFDWHRATYVADTKGSGRVAKLGPVSVAFFAPPF